MNINTRPEIQHRLIVLGLFVFAPTFARAAMPAFPGAQGGGAVSVGGRGGAVIEVTNLNDSGAGSLRACVLASGPRTCVFRVGGTINLLSGFYISNPYLTVAGQTAPGGGILLSGKNTSHSMVMIATHDVIFRYIRVRKGYNSGCADECGANVMMYSDSYNVVINHVSSTWNQDENIGGWSASTPVHDVTVSWNLVAEGIRSTHEWHSTGYITGGSAAGAGGMTNFDWHHNLTMNNSHRNPLAKNRSSRIVNNLTYNNKSYATQLGGGISADIIGNKYKKGPLNANAAWHEIEAYNCCNGSTASGAPSMYLSGNIGWNQTNPAADQWLMARTVGGENGSEGAAIAGAWRRVTPLANTTHPIIAEPVANIEGSILPIVGASRRLDCNDKWVANRDSVDTRLVSQYTNNTGTSVLHPSEAGYGGYPSIAGGTPCTDTDHDGMPDVWETAHGLNPNNAADRNAAAGSGYTNLEVYLAGTGSGTTPATPVSLWRHDHWGNEYLECQ